MLEFLQEHILALGNFAPVAFFLLLVLAGFNLPISADVVILTAATLSAKFLPEKKFVFFLSIYFGCLISAWCAHFLGKFVGNKLLQIRFFSSILKEEKINKIRNFYNKHGFLTLTLGRFIPFGVRNAIFMTTGIANIPFKKFALRDSLACLIWSSTSYFLFFKLAENIEGLKKHLKVFNVIIFGVFILALIIVLWYKLRKKKEDTSPFGT